jgi:D-serine deaminase-like pyridoxal phosphate-dependent protein
MPTLDSLETPSLVLDVTRLMRNAAWMSDRARALGVALRPHVKTHKCAEIARLQTKGHAGGVTVSTLGEAEQLADRGFSDFTYAVPLEPGKLERAVALARRVERLALLTDDAEMPARLDVAAARAGISLDVFVKIDCGYHRCGVEPGTPEAIEIPRRIAEARSLRFAGILTHAGHSYHCAGPDEVRDVARAERDVMVEHAERLRREGIDVPAVSVGSTPTISHVDHLEGIDEIRPGNYIFFDAFQATIGSCAPADCALSVVTAVVHRDVTRRRVVVDAGAIALSKDRGAVEVDPSCGYGRVVSLEGEELGLRVGSLSQEHGEIRVDDTALLDRLKVGARLRVVANHSCLTAAQHSHYDVVEGDRVVDRWEILRGW